jgi:hypothetical protein
MSDVDEAQEVVKGDEQHHSVHRLGPGGIARVDAAIVRRIRNVGEGDLV